MFVATVDSCLISFLVDCSFDIGVEPVNIFDVFVNEGQYRSYSETSQYSKSFSVSI
jgi:hypothetical protein